MELNELMMIEIGGNLVATYIVAFLVFLLSITLMKIFKNIILRKVKKLSDKTTSRIDDNVVKIVESISWPFYVMLSFYLGLQFISIHSTILTIVYYLVLVTIAYYAIKTAQGVIDFIIQSLIAKKETDEQDDAILGLMGKLAKGALWIVVLLLVLANMGVEITALLAGVGIGGIAIGLALQNILADVFASFSIYLDKPFKVGDFIVIGDDSGTVKKIGIKSTRIQTLQGQELVVSNRELTETRVNNYKKMDKRRVAFDIGVTYGTNNTKLKKIPEMITKIINGIDLAKASSVHFTKFGDSALKYNIVYHIDSSEYSKYLEIQQEINLEIKKQFEKEKIDMAYPTQTILLEK